MARKLTFVVNAATSGLIAMADIPADVKADVEEAYETIRSQDGRIRAEFDNKAEADTFCRQAASYCAQRPEGKLRFRRSPTRGLADNVVDFRVTADVPANGAERGAKGSKAE